ncbi:MAG: hypothetical protein KAJ03_09140, partial [Gammaproteobacteria bacterium]|nr:hypothetical protein [Gammaproteobacteria bacterium]
LFVLAIRVRKKLPLFCLGVLWFFGGHVLESTVYPLELVFLHRNYLPSIGILLLTSELIIQLHQKYRVVMAIVAMSVLLGFSFCTRSLAYQWSGDFRIAILEAINNPESIRANFNAGQVIKVYAMFSIAGKQKDENKRMAIEYFNKIRKIDPQDITGELSILETYLQIEEIPPQSLIENLIQELPNSKIDAGVSDIFKTYLNCLKIEKCFLSPDDFERLVNAALENSDRGNVSKADLHMLYAEFLADEKQDIKAAIANAVQAMVSATTLKNIAMLAQYYEKGGYEKLMRRTINLLDELDRFGQYRKFIRESKEKLNVQSNIQ